jgi:DNA-binding transcriptional ArsR family regulator
MVIYPHGETSMQTETQLDHTFHALADRTRRSIRARLTQGEATVNELAAPFTISLPAISKHLKVLEQAGLISRSRDAQYRPCRLEPGPLNEAASWNETHRKHWEESFDRLSEFLDTIQQGPDHDRPA